MTAAHILLVGIGGFFGAISRYSISKKLNGKSTFKLPLGTLTVNLLGAFLLGIITGAKANMMIGLLLGTGFMGAFTTFSTLKLEMIQIHLKNFKRTFILYTIITYGAGIILAYLGYLVGNLFW
ncbi:fluoride efflux transporter CrcB [Bacillus sp. ISL-40]|uniref:fluoride efflux transporter CrcB n=1 Tax=unclassified Bacillus (in: firmicutes) TaxID=185979 RepID=UPI001BEC9D5E|nr:MULTISPECIES: fluoride efflux transporter CrcB [unclassified Bacillus (in: firmicutes)]MBT2696651.1 fluoride efflux transporter CrcB [Bacillus sp. ISL-40]MBT2723768.1 fluoride efflux transporter CrcB [Bacillus sp. ISL-46]MBT2739972.1 fluoride efflux transporter CrcB [Bacillus sp. ISL-77]